MRNKFLKLWPWLIATVFVGETAAAQIWPPFRTVDENGIDLGTGNFLLKFEEGSIGSGPARLPLTRVSVDDRPSQWDEIKFRQQLFPAQGIARATIELPGKTYQRFTAPLSGGGDYAPDINYGETLKTTATGFEYQAADGSKIVFDFQTGLCSQAFCGGQLPPSRIIYPSGNVVTFAYNLFDMTSGADKWRIASVSNGFGYSIDFAYQAGGSGPGSAPPAGWFNRTTATFKKSASTQFTVAYAYPSAGTVDVTDPVGAIWRVTATSIKRPNEASPGFTVAGSPVVTSVTRDGVTTSYTRSINPATTMTKTNPLGQTTVYAFNTSNNLPLSIKDGLNRTTSYQYDASGRITRTTQPEGNYVELTLDSRGNATTTTAVAKSGSGLASIVTGATYDATCTNHLTCNKPNSTTDAKGNVTDYTYDPTHGGALTVTSPAPSTGATRPQIRYSYTAVSGITSLTGTSACATGSAPSCIGTADETKTSIVFDASGNMTSSASGDGSGVLSAVSTMTYDSVGNLLTVDGPLAGVDDTNRFRYDAARRLIGLIGPNPDAAGPLKHRATRNTYRTVGQLFKVERGTVNSQSDPDWAAFAPAETVDIGFNANNKPITQSLPGSAGMATLSQQSYDAAGRVECVAARMNPAIYGSLPASACSLGAQGSFGPDRIAKTLFDAAGQVTEQQVALGTADAATEATLTYTNNGKLKTLKDGENNLTAYVYDGHDRLSVTYFPNPIKGSGDSNGSDFEQLGYDANGNVTNRRLRDATSIAFTYDNLNRPTEKDRPGGEPSVNYAYDNLGRLTSASQTGNALGFTYDALGRNLTQVGPQGTISSQWDIAGRRTRLTWPDGFFVDYDYLVTGEMTKVRENGATSGSGVLATYAYDDLGRRSSLTRGNGAVTSYAYDPVSRLTPLVENMTGSAGDQTSSFAYNPASQISSVTRTNDAYAWTGHGSGSTATTVNGLNQITFSGGSFLHDARGNLTFDAANRSYAYSSENLLISSSASGTPSVSLGYDALNRLGTVSAASTARFAYDGLDMIAEFDGSNNLVRRYVHGPGADELLVEYNSSDWRYHHLDERGSVVAWSDPTGVLATVNRYDEYGRPQAGNIGRFQYTGQMWLPEVGVYYFKARIYSPTLGRFLQTDPIGYAGGINLYAYVGNDPVNSVDPLGLSEIVVTGLPETVDIIGPLGTTRFGNARTALDPSSRLEDVLGRRDGQYCEADHCETVVGQREMKLAFGGGPPIGHNNPPLGWWGVVRKGLGWIGLIFSMEGDTCQPCNDIKFPKDRSNLDHIFSGEPGHFAQDTPANRALILGAIQPQFFVGVNPYGVGVYRQLLPSGSQVWVEVYNYQISNAGINTTPRYGL